MEESQKETLSRIAASLSPEEGEVEKVAKELVVGELTDNTNWLHIQEIGKHISPIGNDKLHKITVWSVRPNSGKVKLASLTCTNSIYSEWVVACSNSMWKTQNKVLEDIEGNTFPVGKMTHTQVHIQY